MTTLEKLDYLPMEYALLHETHHTSLEEYLPKVKEIAQGTGLGEPSLVTALVKGLFSHQCEEKRKGGQTKLGWVSLRVWVLLKLRNASRNLIRGRNPSLVRDAYLEFVGKHGVPPSFKQLCQ